jgi:hypothetical protein
MVSGSNGSLAMQASFQFLHKKLLSVSLPQKRKSLSLAHYETATYFPSWEHTGDHV